MKKKTNWIISVKNKLKQHWLISIVVFSIIFLFIIHILYKIPSINDFWVTNWSAGDMLSYGGAIVGAIATIYVLKETITTTIEMQKDERIFAIRPYFIIKSQQFNEKTKMDSEIYDISKPINSNWNGDINILIKAKNVGAGNALLKEVFVSQDNTDNIGYMCDPVPVIIVNSEVLFLLKKCFASNLNFQMKYFDVAHLAEYKVSVVIRIVRSAATVNTYCEATTIERINAE